MLLRVIWLGFGLACGSTGQQAPGRDDGGASDASSTADAGRAADASSAADASDGAVALACPSLPEPTEPIITVSAIQSADLPSIVREASPGTTILLEPGVYTMTGDESSRRINIASDGITVRSSTGRRDDVIIDGEYQTNEIFFVQASHVAIADLTVRRAVDHLIHATGRESGTIEDLRLYNLALYDSGEQFIKVNSDGQMHYVDQGRLECSLLRMTSEGRQHVETQYGGGCYTGGIDAHGARGWQVRLNAFEGIRCENGSLAEHAVHFWSGARDTLVERNKIVDCARGVGFGLVESGVGRTYDDDPYPGVAYVGHYDGIIRNNLIYATSAGAPYFDTGIELDQARGARVYHNTLPGAATFSSIDYRFSNTQVSIRNNITIRITRRDGASGTVDHNLESASFGLFRDPPSDFRLDASASTAIDQGVLVPEAGLDLDGRPHEVGLPDLGAYEAE